MLSKLFGKKSKPKPKASKPKAAPKKAKEEKAVASPEPAPRPSFKPGKIITAEGWRRLMVRKSEKK